MGTVILGKLESGTISKAQQLVMMPNRVRCLFVLVELFGKICPKGEFFQSEILSRGV